MSKPTFIGEEAWLDTPRTLGVCVTVTYRNQLVISECFGQGMLSSRNTSRLPTVSPTYHWDVQLLGEKCILTQCEENFQHAVALSLFQRHPCSITPPHDIKQLDNILRRQKSVLLVMCYLKCWSSKRLH